MFERIALLLVRIALLVLLFFVVISMVIAIGRPDIGLVEKVVLGGGVAGLVVLARSVRQLGRARPASQTV